MSEHSSGLYLVRNFHTPYRHDHLGGEHSHPSKIGEEEAKKTSAYLEAALASKAFRLVGSPYTARSRESAKIIGARLNVLTIGTLFDATGRQLCSPEEIAEEEARALRGFLHDRNIFYPELPTNTPPAVVAVMSGGGISRYLGLPLSWTDGQHPSPWQSLQLSEPELPGGDDLIPTGAVVEPYVDRYGAFQVRGHAVDLLTAYVAERSKRVRSR